METSTLSTWTSTTAIPSAIEQKNLSDQADGVSKDGWFDEVLFAYVVESVLVTVVGSIGLIGNCCSLVLFVRQKAHKMFHNLLFLLAIFDSLYVVSALLIYAFPRFSSLYHRLYRIYATIILFPVAHIGTTGSVYCTMALTIERYVSVCHPFVHYGRGNSNRWLLIGLIAFSVLYNLPKFFEVRLTEKEVGVCPDDTQVNVNASVCPNSSVMPQKVSTVAISITELRTNENYIRAYLLWMNIILMILGPFVLLIILDVLIYKKIKQFEQNLTLTSQGITFTPKVTVERYKLVTAKSEAQMSSSPNRWMSLKEANEPDRITSAPANHTLSTMTRSSSCVPTKSCSIAVISQRKREVVLAKISLYIVVMFLICHGLRLIPNTYEMISTYSSDYNPRQGMKPWPKWMSCIINVSHFLLTLSCSSNFFIYFGMHSQYIRRICCLPCANLWQRCQLWRSCCQRKKHIADNSFEMSINREESQNEAKAEAATKNQRGSKIWNMSNSTAFYTATNSRNHLKPEA